jgi:hypothetical protein
MKKLKLSVHRTKLMQWIYPLFANEFMFSENYEDFARAVAEKFDLTPDQWENLFTEWEWKNEYLIEK